MASARTKFNTVAHDYWSLPMPECLQIKIPGIDTLREFQDAYVSLW